jgi:predicted DNA-binding transcriptional regulator AlpA
MTILFTKQQVAERLSCHPETVMRLVREGDFPPPMKLGSGSRGHCRWSAEIVERWLAERLQKARAGGAP